MQTHLEDELRAATGLSISDHHVLVVLSEAPGPGSTRTPINLAHVTLQPSAQLDLPWQPDYKCWSTS